MGILSFHHPFYKIHPKDSEEYRRVLKEGIQEGTYKAPHLKLLNPNSKVLDLLKMISADITLRFLPGVRWRRYGISKFGVV